MINRNEQRGFTLLEMIVSLGIFTVVAVIAVGALVRTVSLNRQAQTLQSSMNNISFALESMSRELRVASEIYCGGHSEAHSGVYNPQQSDSLVPQACPSPAGGAIIAFKSARTNIIPNTNPAQKCRLVHAYRLDNYAPNRYKLEKAEQNACYDVLNEYSFSSILDDANLTVDNTQLYAYQGAKGYFRVFLRIAGYAGVRETEKNLFDVQTSISQRITDI